MSAAGDDMAERPPPPVAAVRTIPDRPVRTAVRDEAGRQLVGGAVRLGAVLLPGLVAALGYSWAKERVGDAWDAGKAAWKGKREAQRNDRTIEVKLVEIGRGRRGVQIVDVEEEPKEAVPVLPPGSEKRARGLRRARVLGEGGV